MRKASRREVLAALASSTVAVGASAGAGPPAPILTGLDRLLERPQRLPQSAHRIALVTHAAAVDRQGRRGVDALLALGLPITALWSPEHGLAGSAAAGEHVSDSRDAATGLPIASLYGERRAPTGAMFDNVDAVLVDLQDAGVRPFTYIATLDAVMAAAAAAERDVILLDRPNPLGGGIVAGPVLEPALASFVGVLPVPLRHGLTMGEMALMLQRTRHPTTRLHIVRLSGWRRTMQGEELAARGLPFRPPSPNLRSAAAIRAYAGMVLVEGTNLSEGRGTPWPFEWIGAPWIDADAIAAALSSIGLPGVQCRVQAATPEGSKFAGERCSGVKLAIDRSADAVEVAVVLMSLIARNHPADFAILPGQPPFFDRLAGTTRLRTALQAGESPASIIADWQPALAAYRRSRRALLLY